MSNILTAKEIEELGLQSVGKNVLISRKASFYSPEKISIGDNVRIDDFCILSGNIQIKNYIHIAAFSALYGGKAGIVIEDFCNISSRVSIYAISDDYSGESMTNPMIPGIYKNVIHKKVILEKHVLVGASSVILPGNHLSEGASFGAFSLIKSDSEPWSINAGIPARKIKNRSKNILNLESKFRADRRSDKL